MPLVHQRFASGLHWSWLTKDVLFTSMPAILFALLAQYAASWPVGRLAMAVQLCMFGILFLGITSLSSGKVRASLVNRFSSRIAS